LQNILISTKSCALGWAIFSCFYGAGLLVYIIAAFILPKKSEAVQKRGN
jgi:phage shock protein PspC (stress-responsive transcriptional regulator)